MTRLGRRAVVVAASGTGAVDSVNGETGVVSLVAADIPFTPGGTIAATDVQAAIAEAAAEGGGGAPDAHAPSHESGGSDPITNLGTDLTIAGAVGRDFFFSDDLVATVYLIGRGVDGNQVEITAGASGSVTVQNQVSGSYTRMVNNQFSMSDGVVTLVDIAQQAMLLQSQNPNDPTNPSAKILSSDASLLLEHYDAAGTGTLLSSLVLAEPGSNALDWLLANGTDKRVTLKDDGSGLALYDALGAVWTFIEDGAVQLKAIDDAGTPHAQSGIYLQSIGTFANQGADINVDFLLSPNPANGAVIGAANATSAAYSTISVVADAGISLSGGGAGNAIGVLGATPYGQDAYLAPLDDNLSGLTTLVDLITAENATRTRVNAINGYLIARGWEAAA